MVNTKLIYGKSLCGTPGRRHKKIQESFLFL
jgi:hypothetical protein